LQNLASSARGDECEQKIDKLVEKHSVNGRTPDFVILPECWNATGGDLETNTIIMALGRVAAKHKTYILGGTLVELHDEKFYCTSVLISRDGNILGKYRKRAPIGSAITPGEKVGIFDTVHGRVAIMICFDIENANLLEETLAYKPFMLLNPTFIPAISTVPNAAHSQWKIAIESMSRKFERLSVESNVHIIRCDTPMWSAMGTSQMIAPYRTVTSPTFTETDFCVYIDKRYVNEPKNTYRTESDMALENDWKEITIDPSYVRTDSHDNVHNRYNVITILNAVDDTSVMCFHEEDKLIVAQNDRLNLFSYRDRKLIHWISSPKIECLASFKDTIYGAGEQLYLWKVVEKKIVLEKTVNVPTEGKLVNISVTEQNIILGDTNGSVIIYDKNFQVKKYKLFAGVITGIVYNDNHIYATSDHDSFIRVISLNNDNIMEISGHGSKGYKSLQLCQEAGIIVSLSNDGNTMNMWKDNEVVNTVQDLRAVDIVVAFTRNVFVRGNGKELSLIRVENGKCIHRFHPPTIEVENDRITSVICRNNRIAYGNRSGVHILEFLSNRVASNMTSVFK
jgi:predicted amidohydrolase